MQPQGQRTVAEVDSISPPLLCADDVDASRSNVIVYVRLYACTRCSGKLLAEATHAEATTRQIQHTALANTHPRQRVRRHLVRVLTAAAAATGRGGHGGRRRGLGDLRLGGGRLALRQLRVQLQNGVHFDLLALGLAALVPFDGDGAGGRVHLGHQRGVDATWRVGHKISNRVRIVSENCGQNCSKCLIS